MQPHPSTIRNTVLLAVLAGAILVGGNGGSALAQSPLGRTSPGHQQPPPPGYDLPMVPPIVRFPLKAQWVAIELKKDWRKAGRFEKDMSRACANRRFNLRFPMHFRVYYDRQVLGVAFGHGLNLNDPGRLADPARTYLFRNADSTACTVISMLNEDVLVQRIYGQPPPQGQQQGQPLR